MARSCVCYKSIRRMQEPLRARIREITVDNRTEFTSKALDHWAYRNRLKLDYTQCRSARPGRLAYGAPRC